MMKHTMLTICCPEAIDVIRIAENFNKKKNYTKTFR